MILLPFFISLKRTFPMLSVFILMLIKYKVGKKRRTFDIVADYRKFFRESWSIFNKISKMPINIKILQ
jgi:hypothetical protein